MGLRLIGRFQAGARLTIDFTGPTPGKSESKGSWSTGMDEKPSLCGVTCDIAPDPRVATFFIVDVGMA
jgi:hypothetical protein